MCARGKGKGPRGLGRSIPRLAFNFSSWQAKRIQPIVRFDALTGIATMV
jgi:hypothetical protein